MKGIFFGDFRTFVIQYVILIDKQSFDVDSIEWFLLKYLKRVVKSTEPEDAAGRVESSMRSLMRFYVDNIDEKSETGDHCIKIYAEYRKTLHRSQTK
jgi:hypothetical protein